MAELFDKIVTMENLRAAHRNARKDKSHYKEVQMVDSNPDYYLKQIQDMLINHAYTLSVEDYTISTIFDKGKERELWKLSYYPHRIIQWAFMLYLEPIFMDSFTDFTCASIKNRGIHYALEKTKKILEDEENSKYCLKVDIQQYYHSIDHTILKNKLRKIIDDAEILYYLDLIIDSKSSTGIPIGSYLSQYLANFYLADLDKWLYNQNRRIVRYMDDIVIFDNLKENLHVIKKEMQENLKNKLKLNLKQNYSIFPSNVRGVDFLGYVIYSDKIKLRKTTAKNLKRKMIKMHNKVLDYSDLCCYNSYIGWLSYCTDKGLMYKFLYPIKYRIKRGDIYDRQWDR